MTTEQKTPQATKLNLSIETAVKAVADSLVMGRKALNTELAVCLAIFAAEGNTEQAAKSMVTEVYVKAGYDAANSNSRHYKTVNRRVNAAAGLFTMVSAPTVLEWVGKSQEEKMIAAILKGLDEYKFDSMDDVLEFCGRPNNRTTKATQASDQQQAKGPDDQEVGKDQGEEQGEQQAKAEKPGPKMLRFVSHRVRVEIREDAPSEDMLKVAAKIIRAARDKEQQELQAAIAHPSAAPNVAPAVLH